jgi:hypothetical protein
MFFKEKIPLQDSEWNDYFDRHIDSGCDFFADGFKRLSGEHKSPEFLFDSCYNLSSDSPLRAV